eukprot:scaffold535797_cov17-Prasinocladus_malaysianus.AAC.1
MQAADRTRTSTTRFPAIFVFVVVYEYEYTVHPGEHNEPKAGTVRVPVRICVGYWYRTYPDPGRVEHRPFGLCSTSYRSSDYTSKEKANGIHLLSRLPLLFHQLATLLLARAVSD